ncbi:16080_t:CDS:2 [Funneliformis mosseae]|uniref:16080_t:CDS:1 n=1 Tax=Funneliformis mosseae TaxID=27381 RepID=A0A9N9A5R2_FUNMO|nr:16080_t:CDS:2 [Funneliformis mosseae]
MSQTPPEQISENFSAECTPKIHATPTTLPPPRNYTSEYLFKIWQEHQYSPTRQSIKQDPNKRVQGKQVKSKQEETSEEQVDQ